MTQLIHPLAAWIDERMSRRDFAGKAGCSESHLSNTLKGKSPMSLELAVKIEEITAGEFPAARLLREQKSRMEAPSAAREGAAT